MTVRLSPSLTRSGRLGWSKSGEMTIFVTQLQFLTESLETPPDKYHGLVDADLRQRMRYLDLIHGEGVRVRFVARSKIVEAVRRVLATRDYLEVEGPTLQETAGGAAASIRDMILCPIHRPRADG